MFTSRFLIVRVATAVCAGLAFLAAVGARTASAVEDLTKTSPGTAVSAARATASTIPAETEASPFVLDDFNRPDGPLGSKWTVRNGTLGIVGGAVQGSGGTGLATYNHVTSNVLEADVAASGTPTQYYALVLGYADNSRNIFVKVQSQGGIGQFNWAACYSGNNASPFGPGFFALSSPFSTAHMKVTLEGSTVTLVFSNIDGGSGTQTYSCNGAPATGGNGIGIGTYSSYGSIDNFSTGVATPSTPIQTIRLADLNGNGKPEEATLVQDNIFGGVQVWIRDGVTKLLLKKIPFGFATDIMPIGLAEVTDMNANGAPEVAVMSRSVPTGSTSVTIRDAKSKSLLNSVPFGTVQGKSVTVLPDTSGNGIPEIGAMVFNHGTKTHSLILRDARSDALVRTISLP